MPTHETHAELLNRLVELMDAAHKKPSARWPKKNIRMLIRFMNVSHDSPIKFEEAAALRSLAYCNAKNAECAGKEGAISKLVMLCRWLIDPPFPWSSALDDLEEAVGCLRNLAFENLANSEQLVEHCLPELLHAASSTSDALAEQGARALWNVAAAERENGKTAARVTVA